MRLRLASFARAAVCLLRKAMRAQAGFDPYPFRNANPASRHSLTKFIHVLRLVTSGAARTYQEGGHHSGIRYTVYAMTL